MLSVSVTVVSISAPFSTVQAVCELRPLVSVSMVGMVVESASAVDRCQAGRKHGVCAPSTKDLLGFHGHGLWAKYGRVSGQTTTRRVPVEGESGSSRTSMHAWERCIGDQHAGADAIERGAARFALQPQRPLRRYLS